MFPRPDQLRRWNAGVTTTARRYVAAARRPATVAGADGCRRQEQTEKRRAVPRPRQARRLRRRRRGDAANRPLHQVAHQRHLVAVVRSGCAPCTAMSPAIFAGLFIARLADDRRLDRASAASASPPPRSTTRRALADVVAIESLIADATLTSGSPTPDDRGPSRSRTARPPTSPGMRIAVSSSLGCEHGHPRDVDAGADEVVLGVARRARRSARGSPSARRARRAPARCRTG